MNLEVIAQLTILALIVTSGPLAIALLVARKGNLWFQKVIPESKSLIGIEFGTSCKWMCR